MKIKAILRWAPALLVMAAIFAFSSLPSADIPKFDIWDTFVKKGGHMAGYALLAGAYARGLEGRPKALWLAWIFAVIYALTDELHQTFVPGRHGSLLDVLIDATGAGLGLLALTWVRNRVNQ